MKGEPLLLANRADRPDFVQIPAGTAPLVDRVLHDDQMGIGEVGIVAIVDGGANVPAPNFPFSPRRVRTDAPELTAIPPPS